MAASTSAPMNTRELRNPIIVPPFELFLLRHSVIGAVYQPRQNPDSIDSKLMKMPQPRAKTMSKSGRFFRSDCCLLALLLVALAAPAHAQSGTDFKGETISIQIGYGPGGGYDTY